MSSTKELADREAAIAEADLTGAETERVVELERDGTPLAAAIAAVLEEREPAEPASLPQSAKEEETGEPDPKRLHALEQAIGDHLERVAGIMGPFVAGYEPCRECGGAGLTQPEPEVLANPNFRACPTCNGYGVVKTGARNESHYTRACPDCAGRGYQERLDSSGAPLAPAPGTPGTPAAPPAAPPLEGVENGNGGEPAEPTFGVPQWMGDPSLGR